MLKDETEKTQLSDDNNVMARYKRENWDQEPSPSNVYFYGMAFITCVFCPLAIFILFDTIFSGSSGYIFRFSFWGLVASFALHIHRLRTYRCTPRRVKSAFPIILFVFICFCTVLLVDGWDFKNIYINRGIMFCYVASTSLFIYWCRLNNHDDRLIMLCFLGINWFLSVCFSFLFSYPDLFIYMLLTAFASYLVMAHLQERVREAFYWVCPPGKILPRDASLLLCFIAVISLTSVGLMIYLLADTEGNRQLYMGSTAALHFAVSLLLASEYVLYMLNKCGLLILDEKKDRL